MTDGLFVNGLLHERKICVKCKGTQRRGLGPCLDCEDGFIYSLIGRPVKRDG